MLSEARPSRKLALMKTLQISHQHTPKDHHFGTAAAIAKLFRDTTDPAVNCVKANVCGIQNCVPLLYNTL
jgi:hypothetical protein